MRPPVLPSGNRHGAGSAADDGAPRFNEAAGFTQRKLQKTISDAIRLLGFNEAAGFTQRKRQMLCAATGAGKTASMRPPVLPSGNSRPMPVRYE